MENACPYKYTVGNIIIQLSNKEHVLLLKRKFSNGFKDVLIGSSQPSKDWFHSFRSISSAFLDNSSRRYTRHSFLLTRITEQVNRVQRCSKWLGSQLSLRKFLHWQLGNQSSHIELLSQVFDSNVKVQNSKV